ncbi:uncharacterized protein LOC135963030 [Calliphora vicina]|uniref:uncharacterized protein LOC135963030 n=1 Tax=Calliphora vicina TaxID=7373 RepID=UPI00325BB22B
MDPLTHLSEEALLEDYDETMEVDSAATTTTTGSTSQSEVVAVIESSTAIVVTDQEVPLTSPENSSAPAVVPAPDANITTNPDPVSGAVEASGSNPVGNSRNLAKNCRICDRKHQLSSCRKFINMTCEKRIRMVLLHHYCSRCFSANHISRDCSSQGCCKTCKGKHHSMLHYDNNVAAKQMKSKKRSRTSDPRPAVSNELPSMPLFHPVSFSPTATVLLLISDKSIRVRAVLDLCCSMSYICSSLVANLKLPVSTVNEEKFCKVNICSLYEASRQISLTVKVKTMHGIKTPVETVSDTIKDHFEGMQLADPSFNMSGKVALVIGPEVAPQIMRGKIYSNPGLPMAQYTIFGWVISGQAPR